MVCCFGPYNLRTLEWVSLVYFNACSEDYLQPYRWASECMFIYIQRNQVTSCRSRHRLVTKKLLELGPQVNTCCPAYRKILLPKRSEGNTTVSDLPYARQSWQSTVVSCPNCSYITISPDDCIGNEFCDNDMFQT